MMQKIKNGILAVTFVLLLSLTFLSPATAATKNDPCHPELNGGSPLTAEQFKSCENCNKPGIQDCLQNNVIVRDLNVIINILTGIVTIVMIAMIIIGGIQYTMAGGNPQKAADARKRITNALIAMFVFLFLWSFLQWLVPGGVF